MAVAAAAAAVMLIGTGASALAATRQIVVSDGVKVVVDGITVVPRDRNGNQVENITFNGTTYAPVGTLAEASGYLVDYSRTGEIRLTTQTPSSQNGYIGDEAAKQRALNHAGVGELSATFISVTKEWQNGVMMYRVEFLVGDTEYDYTVNAVNGAITGWDFDIDWYQGAKETETYIGIEKAKELALKDARLAGKSVFFVKTKLDWDDTRAEYDIEFVYGNTEYDYEIDALTGTILEKDWDIEDYAIPDSGNYIGLENAKEIARKDAGASSSVTYHEAKLDRDDGRMIYEIEFYSGNTEYDYEIDALTGTILKKDYDIEGFAIPSTETGNKRIGKEKAKEIALEKAPGAKVTDCDLDTDDGRSVYEIEMKNGRMEYECKIDAYTGKILTWESEYDD